MSSVLTKILEEMPKVTKVFQKQAGIDGFSVKINNHDTYDISRTYWSTDDVSRWVDDKYLFTIKGEDEIVFDRKYKESVDKLLGIVIL